MAISVHSRQTTSLAASFIRKKLQEFIKFAFPLNLERKSFPIIIEISLVARSESFRVNRIYREIPRSCDILTIPFHASSQDQDRERKERILRAMMEPRATQSPLILGHLIICPAVLFRKIGLTPTAARVMPLAVQLKLRKHLAHAFAHLLYFDHHSKSQYRAMSSYEQRLLQ